MHLKKNQLLTMYWLILIGFVTSTLVKKFGAPFLFLDPEYAGKVGFTSFFIVGLACGIFIMAFNISSYILNSFRFPFLATLSMPFQKYSYNNFIIPGSFIIIYISCIISFQFENELNNAMEIGVSVFALLSGISIVIFITLRYFLLTNKDIYKLYGFEKEDEETADFKSFNKLDANSKGRKKKSNVSKRTQWRVETYLSFPLKIKLVRSTSHYKDYMLHSVFKQNHINAAVVEMIVFVIFITLGLFSDFTFFRIPAAASVLLLFTMIIMLSGVFRFWLRSWANTLFVVLFVLLNFLSQFESINQRNRAYGLNYDGILQEYSRENMEKYGSRERFESDKSITTRVLSNWKRKWKAKGVEKPTLVLFNSSGGGVRSMLFTFRTMQTLDSVLNGSLMEHTVLISGSSGGIISSGYYRELFLSHREELQKASHDIHNRFIENIGKDLLNATAFSATVSDIFLNLQKVKVGKYSYVRDRAYAFEKQLNENTEYVLNKTLGQYRLPEFIAEIPMLLISPTILNDGRVLQISPLPVSYMIETRSNSVDPNTIANGIEFSSFFARQNAAELKFTSALRMNATFPYVNPSVSLPSEPTMEVMDAGIRDNYGIKNTLRFLFVFRDWIKTNTAGVVVIQVRDTYKDFEVEDNSVKTFFQKLSAPFKNLTGNFIIMQDYENDALVQFAKTAYNGPLDFITFQMPEMEEKISLSWHLTRREKNFIKDVATNNDNAAALVKVKKILEHSKDSLD